MPISITLTGSDNEGAPLTYVIVDLPDHGLLDDLSLPAVLYTPDADYFGDDSFSFKVNDGVQDSNVAVVDIAVAADNDPPTANDQSVSTNADTPLDIILTAQDIDGGALSYFVVSGPANGTLDGANAPNVTYTPNPGFDGSDSFTFKANDTFDDSEAATVSITVNPSGPVVVFSDDFESNLGWVTNPNGTDTATTGMWARANPEPVDSSGPKQLGDTVSGSNALVTGPLAGSSAGSHDIDSGVTSVRSPAIVLPAGKDLTLDFHYYLAHRSNSSTADFLRVSVIGSGTTVVFEELGAGNDDDAFWAQTSVSLNAFAGQTVRLLIEAADASNGSLVEAAVDDVSIIASAPATAILQAGFDSGDEGFSYVDNAFSSGNAAYASGSWQAGGGYGGGGLQVYLGGQDNADILNMSGGWREQFNLASASSTVLTFRYNLTIDAEYESDEYSEVRVTVGSQAYTVTRITGDGNGGSDDSSGWQLAQIDLGSLPSGNHTLTIGVYNNKKTYNNEWSTVNIDDVTVAVR
jgi:hypothetical protein